MENKKQEEFFKDDPESDSQEILSQGRKRDWTTALFVVANMLNLSLVVVIGYFFFY